MLKRNNKKRLMELAGIPEDLQKKILTENVEDEQGEAVQAIEDALESMPPGAKRDKLEQEYHRFNQLFSDGYESGDDDMMYDGLDGLQYLASKV